MWTLLLPLPYLLLLLLLLLLRLFLLLLLLLPHLLLLLLPLPHFLLLLLPSSFLQKKYPECGDKEGYAPIVTIPTLHQVHYLLFFMAVTHIVIGAIVLAISTTKLK
jgi:hypothetical protein